MNLQRNMKKEEYPIIKKAWKIKVEDLDEPWHFDDIIEYGETANQARYALMKSSIYYDMQIIEGYNYTTHRNNRRDVEYRDVKARRCSAKDVVLYKRKEVKRYEIEQIDWVEERDKYAYSIVADSPDAVCVVRAGCYNQWWGANHAGYTSSIERAGKYTPQEALKIVLDSDYSRQEVVQVIDKDKYNSDINDQIIELENEILKLKGFKL